MDSDEENKDNLVSMNNKDDAEDSIEEELDIDLDDNDNDLEQQMERVKINTINNIPQAKIPIQNQKSKRLFSARYQLKSLKESIPKPSRKSSNDRTNKTSVIEALKKENNKISNVELERRMKAETKKSRPFSTLVSREDKSVKSNQIKGQENYEEISIEINDESSIEDLERCSEPVEMTYEQGIEYAKIKVNPILNQTDPVEESQSRKLEIIQKIENLNETQRQQLFVLLERLEKGNGLNDLLS
mmetsp:Transcript_4922/g.4176  ORF Transcript_4922/g.4176 Transcript_4922/m.4176 type:complete len:244 (-) Transcript_4922:30-761(-)